MHTTQPKGVGSVKRSWCVRLIARKMFNPREKTSDPECTSIRISEVGPDLAMRWKHLHKEDSISDNIMPNKLTLAKWAPNSPNKLERVQLPNELCS